MVKKWDIILIALLVVISFIPELIFVLTTNKNYKETYAEISIEGKLYDKVILSNNKGEKEMNIQTKYGYNLIKIKDQSIAIIDTDCPDKICERPGFVSKPGQSLVCLPHKLIVEIKGYGDSNDNDIIPAF